jgi:hypothetical protein
MIKKFNDWAKLEEQGNEHEIDYTISQNKYDISESWEILDKPNLNRLDEHSFTSAISRDEFINEAFPFLNESEDEYSKNKIFALYETQLFYTHREEWFNESSKSNKTPILFESKTHTFIFYNDRSFAISKESYNILMSNSLNEGIFDVIGDVFSGAGKIIGDAVNSVVDTVGGWANSLGDAAKSVVGFIGTCYDSVAVFVGDDWIKQVQTISTLFRGIYGTVGQVFAPGTGQLMSTIVGGATGLLGLYDGYTKIKDPISDLKSTIGSAKSALDVGTALTKHGPNILAGSNSLILGAKDIIGVINPSPDVLSGITDITSLFDKSDDSLKTQGQSFFSKENASGLGSTLLSMAGIKGKDGIKPESLVKDLQPHLISLGGTVALEYLIPSDMKDTVLKSVGTIQNGIDTAFKIPNQVGDFVKSCEEEGKKGGTMGMLSGAVSSLGKPISDAMSKFTSSIKPSIQSVTSPMENLSKKFNNTLNLLAKSKTNIDLQAPEIVVTEKIVPQKVVKLPKKDFKSLKRHASKIKTKLMKESYFDNYETWLKENNN